MEEQHAAYGSSPIDVELARPVSDIEPEGHEFPAAAQVAQLDGQHVADFFSYPAGQARSAPHWPCGSQPLGAEKVTPSQVSEGVPE